MQQRGYVRALTGVRAFAALWVISLHLGRFVTYPEPLRTLAASGAAGVSVFFVLSGLVLTVNYVDRVETDRRSYLRARVARIVPLYLVTLALGVAASGYALYATALQFDQLIGRASLRGHAAAGLLDLAGLQAWVPWPPWRDAFNSPAWSVSAEVAFYLAFPWIATKLLPRLRTMRSVLVAAGFAFGSMLIVNVVAVAAVSRGSRTAQQVVLATLYTVPLLRLPEFLLGCLAGVLLVRGQVPFQLGSSERRRNLVLVACAAWMVLVMASADWTTAAPLQQLDLRRHVVFLPAVVPALLVLESGRTALHALLEWRPVQELGLASYALYLVHWPLLQPVLLHERATGDTRPGALVALLLFVAVVVAALALHRYLEEPLRRRLRGESAALLTAS